MKIIYIHQYFATPEASTGTRSYEMARRLVKKGHKVDMVTSSAVIPKKYIKKKGWNIFDCEGIKVHALNLSYSNKDDFSKRIYKFFVFSIQAALYSIKLKNADIVFATSTPLTIAIPGVICSKANKIPMVFEVRDLWPELPIAIGALKSPFSKFLAKKMEEWAYNHSTRVIGLSPGMTQGVMKKGVLKANTATIPNSCDLGIFNATKKDAVSFKEKLNWLKNKKLVVYTGTIGIINGVSYLVSLALEVEKENKNICFLVIGDGVESEKVRNYAIEKGVWNKNFFMMPPVKKTEMPAVLAAADVAFSLFLPIKEMWHNSANKFFDALASGTPVVINYGGWQSDLLKEFPAGISIDPDDISIAAKEFLLFVNCPYRIDKAKINAKKLAEKKFNRDYLAIQFEAELLKAIGKDKDSVTI